MLEQLKINIQNYLGFLKHISIEFNQSMPTKKLFIYYYSFIKFHFTFTTSKVY